MSGPPGPSRPGAPAGPPAPDARAWGVEPGYWDVTGRWRDIPGHTVQAVLEAMGARSPEPPGTPPLITLGPSGPWPELPEGTLFLGGGRPDEAGPVLGTVQIGSAGVPGGQPDELPLGYHRLEPLGGGGPLVVAVCPATCPPPPASRTWGWSAQLYATRSETSWGIGDFADLRRLVRWAGKNGAGFVLVNPLHAPAPGPVPEPSPYFPSSRCFLNPIYIRPEEIPGAGDLPEMAALAAEARDLNGARLIDRTRVWALKSQAFEALFASFERAAPCPGFEAYIRDRGKVLDAYTSFCALAEIYGLPWASWPEACRRPDGPGVAEFAATPAGRSRKRYHAWLQWLCEVQFAEAANADGTGLLCDLAVGADGGGADAWIWQDAFALGMRVGAPPDDFNTKGQDWGLPPWDPWKLRAGCYEPYIQMLRAVLRSAQGLRVDHVMGLFRLFWIPLGCEPADGAYVRSVWSDMVALLRLEASRAGAYIVGEDLGTVEDHVRDVLGQSGVLSYKLLWFEPRPPREWPRQAFGAVTTHDLPTVAGVWTGADVDAQRRTGLPVNEKASAGLRQRLAEWTGSPDDRPVGDVVLATYECLAAAPCALVVASLDDALAVEERPNMPGTIDQWPNWCLALPEPLEEIEQNPLVAAIAQALGQK